MSNPRTIADDATPMLNTEILVITDRSGSMGVIASDVIGGYNRFIEDQRKEPGEARVTFAQFNDTYSLLYSGKPLADAPGLTHDTYRPMGSTALLDALGRTLNEQGQRIAQEQWADLVIVCVITDGLENASREYSPEKVKQMIAHAEEHGWKFVYLAANQNAMQVAQNIGMNSAISMSYAANAAGTATAYSTLGAVTRSLRSGDKITGDVTGSARP